MPSAFAHAVSALAIGKAFQEEHYNWKFWLGSIICSAIPDIDVAMFSFGIPYEHWLGHRGFLHSIPFSFGFGLLMGMIMYGFKIFQKDHIPILCCFILCTLSHGLLDMTTNGGHGIALFAPFSDERYFFAFRPIQVSPIGVENFFSEWGWRVLVSEAKWVGLPSLFVYGMISVYRKIK